MDYRQAIAELEQDLERHRQRGNAIENALDGLRALAGDVDGRKKSGRRALSKRTDGRTEQKPGRRAARSRPDHANPIRAPRQPSGTRPRVELVPARDEAITAALRKGPAPSTALLATLPKEPGQTAGQREDALRNALTRLRLKKQIRQVDEGWALA